MASPVLTGHRDRSAVLRDGPLASRPRHGAPPRSRQAHPPTSPVQVQVPSRPIPARGHHPACGQLLPGPGQYHRRRMIRYCLHRSRRPASQTRHHPAGAPRPAHRPSAHRPRTHRPRTHRPMTHRAGRPRLRRSAHRSRTRAVRPLPPPRWAQPCRRIRIPGAGRPSPPPPVRPPGPPPPVRPPGPPPPVRPPGRESGLPPRLRSRWPGSRPAT